MLLVRERYADLENMDEKLRKKLDTNKFEQEVRNLIL